MSSTHSACRQRGGWGLRKTLYILVAGLASLVAQSIWRMFAVCVVVLEPSQQLPRLGIAPASCRPVGLNHSSIVIAFATYGQLDNRSPPPTPITCV